MKKALYLLAATALLASCNQEVLVDPNTPNPQPEVSRSIGFETFVDKATRATGTGTNCTALNDYYTTFHVYGWKTVGDDVTCVFDNIPVEYFTEDEQGSVVYDEADEKPSNEWTFKSNSWYYQNIRYWDKMASHYLFSAFTPTPSGVSFNCTNKGLIEIGSKDSPVTVDSKNLMTTPATALAYTGFDKDYMTAQMKYERPATTTGTYILDPVALNFSHLQAKLNIRVKLDPSMKTAQDISIQKIQVHNLGDKAYYTNAANTGISGWTLYQEEATEEMSGTTNTEGGEVPTAASKDYVPTVVGPYSLNNATKNYNGFYVLEQLIIPQTIAKFTPSESTTSTSEEGGENAGENTEAEGSEEDDNTSTESATVAIPVSLTEYTQACVYVEYTIGNEKFKSFSPLANIFIGKGAATAYDFEGGMQYTLNITIGPKPIEFTAVVSEWETEINGDLPMD